MPPIAKHELEASNGKPALPTYQTIADVMEKRNGSGLKLVGYTFARTIMIAPFMMLVKVPAKQAWGGALLSSAAISLFALVRIWNANYELERTYFSSRRWARRKAPAPRALQRAR